MDPRPYTYEYRKPRLTNPTFRSESLYGSMYHMNANLGSKRFQPTERVDKIINSPSKKYSQEYLSQVPPRASSSLPKQIQKQQPINFPPLSQQPLKPPPPHPKLLHKKQNQSLDISTTHDTYRNNLLSHGGRIVKSIPGSDQDRIYARQEKNFDIINFHPKMSNPVHRRYPKFTLENQLLESSKYEMYKNSSS